jgi:hypothetical protein
MIDTLHVLSNVIKRQDYPFVEIVNQLNHKVGHYVVNISLSEQQLAVTKRIEYSFRRWIRWFYYGPVFRHLEEIISHIIRSNNCRTIIYLCDEGVWAECVKTIIQNLGKNDVKVVIVQHGIHFHEVPNRVSLLSRKCINYLFQFLTGFPVLGLGFGGSRCDLYLTYTSQDSKFLRLHGLNAVEAGLIIKKNLIDNVKNIEKPKRVKKVALFALQPISDSFGFVPGESRFYRKIVVVAEYLATKHQLDVVFRPHPGSELSVVSADLQQCGLLKYGSIQDPRRVDVSEALSQADIVLSHSSTVLIDAILTGKKAIQLLENAKSKIISVGNSCVMLNSLDCNAQIDKSLEECCCEDRRLFLGETVDVVKLLQSVLW